MKKVYITGTDTGIGKTYFSGLLCAYLADQGYNVAYVKPVQTGYPADDDARTVREMSGLIEDNCKVLHTAVAPVAPYIAFDNFPYDETVEAINKIDGFDWLIVEGAGGIMVPLSDEHMNYDLVKDCGLNVLTVVPNRLGCINHSLLTKHFCETSGIDFAGFAMNNHFISSAFDRFNISMLNDLTAHSVRFVFSNDLEYTDVNW
ncbi:MAG: dethiobiotin synthase [Denitrovibrio sp.]|nr:MAG: dethiobiotin synthase [Denitrovibrio sp.]